MTAEARQGRLAFRVRGILALALALAMAMAVTPWSSARADLAPAPAVATSRPAPRWLAFEALTGIAQLDADLADDQWDVGPRPAWGLVLLAGLDRLALGLRMTRFHTEQTIGQPSAPEAEVTAMQWEALGRARLGMVAGTGLHLSASAGTIAFSWNPDRVTVEVPGGSPVIAALTPVTRPIAGAGLAFDRSLGGPWGARLDIERQWFALDTARSTAGGVVVERRSHGTWCARAGLSWRAWRSGT